jgi:hypothetical protein
VPGEFFNLAVSRSVFKTRQIGQRFDYDVLQDRPMLLSIKMVVDEDPPFESDCPSTPSSMWSCRSSRLNPYSRRLINTPTFKIGCPFFSRREVV